MIDELFSLKGKTAVVTGASRGIGERFARVLDAAGACVIAVARSADRLHALAEDLEHPAQVIAADLSQVEDCSRAVRESLETAGSVDILVNCAGVSLSGPTEDLALEDWEFGHNVNVRSAFLLSQGFGRGMIERGSGKIINVASLLSFMGDRSGAIYASSKSGLMGLTRALAVEWARKGVQVNAICPGWIATEIVARFREDERFERRVINSTPARRWGTTGDLDGAILFLSSGASDFMNGQALVVDGGLMAAL